MPDSPVEKVLISDIKVENRRREEFGDIEGLAESIGKLGLIQPIVVDEEYHLIAGERRLRACQQLGWFDVPVRLYRDLSEAERREIELEENVRRKDFTPYELSKNLVRLVETAAEVLRKDSLLNANNESPRKRGGQPKPDADTKIAERIGVPQPTISVARHHVAAVERYPELAVVAPTQKDAITVAKNLDALPDSDRDAARSRLMKHDQSTLAVLAEKPPMPAYKPKSEKTPSLKWREWIGDLRLGLSGIANAGTSNLARRWSPTERQLFVTDLRGFRVALDQLINELEEQRDEADELEQQAG